MFAASAVVIRSTLKRVMPTTIRRSTPVCVSVVAPRYYSSTRHDNDPVVLEREKNKNLKRAQHMSESEIDESEDAPGWNEKLASESEADVKADRSRFKGTFEELESRTVEKLKAEEIEIDSNGEERMEAGEAMYERDEISGPLKGKGKKTDDM